MSDCEEEFDSFIREAKFAFRSTDLGSWGSSCPIISKGSETDIDPVSIQHWALVVYFARGNKTFVFEAWKGDDSCLQAGRGIVQFEDLFKSSHFLGSLQTSPLELLNKAKSVDSIGKPYSLGLLNNSENNCQTWLKQFLKEIDESLLNSLCQKINFALLD